jgi:hypothetical protein
MTRRSSSHALRFLNDATLFYERETYGCQILVSQAQEQMHTGSSKQGFFWILLQRVPKVIWLKFSFDENEIVVMTSIKTINYS